MKTIGEKIRYLRKDYDYELTLKEVSKETGISVSFLSDIETGRSMPSLKTCQKLANLWSMELCMFFLNVEIDIKGKVNYD